MKENTELVLQCNNTEKKQLKKEYKKAVDTILYMVAYTLNYKLGLGKKRLPEIMYYIANNIDSYNTGHLTHEDYIEIKRQMNELGVILVDRNKMK